MAKIKNQLILPNESSLQCKTVCWPSNVFDGNDSI